MALSKGERTYECKALTDLWTGSVTLKEKGGRIKEETGPKRFITASLLGSIRWWFEVLVRGLDGYACDPTETKCEDRKHCIVCELFGCTGWARKFKFEVLDENGKSKMDQIKQDKPFFSLRFTPLRPICTEEWNLLDATLRLIGEYGAIGGKTVFKPTDEQERQRETHHQDFGLIELLKSDGPRQRVNTAKLGNYVREKRWKKPEPKGKAADFTWASLKNFWFIDGKYLARQNSNISTFNFVIGRPEPKQQSGQNDSWIAGRRPDRRNNVEAESKKVFSFKNPARTFGFVKPGLIDFTAMKQKLEDPNIWGKNGWDFLTGEKIINELFACKEDRL
jgi:CRISPR-associated protein Cmr1